MFVILTCFHLTNLFIKGRALNFSSPKKFAKWKQVKITNMILQERLQVLPKFCLSSGAHYIQIDAHLLNKNWINLYDLDLNCSSKFEPASKLATGEAGKEARLLAQELRPVLTFLAARVNERHLRLSLFFFEWSADTERFWGSDWRNEVREVGLLLLLPLSKVWCLDRYITVFIQTYYSRRTL